MYSWIVPLELSCSLPPLLILAEFIRPLPVALLRLLWFPGGFNLLLNPYGCLFLDLYSRRNLFKSVEKMEF